MFHVLKKSEKRQRINRRIYGERMERYMKLMKVIERVKKEMEENKMEGEK